MNPHVKQFFGYILSATDSEIGKIKDFYFDDDMAWTIRYLVVETVPD